MRSRLMSQACVAGLAIGMASVSFAALLNDLTGFPSLVTDQTGSIAYNKTTRMVSVRSAPLAIRFSATTAPHFVTATPDNNPQLLTIDIKVGNNGKAVDGFAGEDLYIYGAVTDDNNVNYSGVLLSGEIVKWGYLNSGTTDQYDFRFTVSGGALAPLFDGKDIGVKLTSENSTFNNSFCVNFGGGCKAVVGPIDPLPYEGCTAGYWKCHTCGWPTPYKSYTKFEPIFGRDVPGNPTLLDALRAQGDGLNGLMRAATAALLNAKSSIIYADPAYDTTAEVIAAFQEAYDSGDYDAGRVLLEASNDNGCPLH